MQKYLSLQDVYLNKSFARSLPPLPRQTINWLMEAVADAPPPAPDSAYVQLYVKDPSKNEQQFVGNIDVDYFNKVVRPVLSRGKEGAIDINRLVEKRLNDANITKENLIPIFDFIQAAKIQISSENFGKCHGAFKTAIASQAPFNIADILSKSFNTPLENMSGNATGLETLMDLKTKPSSADRSNRSGEAGPGEVVIAFFGNGRKLVISSSKSKQPADRGDVALGELFLEVKAGEARVYPTKEKNATQGKPAAYFAKYFKEAPLNVVKYLTFGDAGLSENRFDNEINSGLSQGIDPRTLATGLSLREYQVKGGFHYYVFVNKANFKCIGLTCADKNIAEISKFYTAYLGNRNLGFDFKDGHQLPKTYKF